MFGFLSKEKSLERKYKRLSKRLSNMWAQAPDRAFAAQQLAEMETPDSIAILLSRFELRTQNHTIDKDEKTDIRGYLTEMGDQVIEPTLAHLRKETTKNVNWPFRVLSAFLEDDALADLLGELLDAEDTEYGRAPERKEELVLTAADYPSEALGKALVRMLDDANEPVRFLAVDAILKQSYPFAREPILERLTDEDESRRVTSLILEQLVENEWTVKGHKAAVEGFLPEGYAITRSGTIRRRGA